MNTAKVVVVDADSSILETVVPVLEGRQCSVECNTSDQLFQHLRSRLVADLILLDLGASDPAGLRTLQRLLKVNPKLQVIVVSGSNDTRTIVESIRLGARDYLTKPVKEAELIRALTASLTHQQSSAGRDADDDGRDVEELGDDVFFLAASAVMRTVRTRAFQVANLKVPVLLLGESGTGKEVVARLIHKVSSRSGGPFLKVNCAAVPADLLESELFGYEPGAFTGATRPKPGKFEMCHKGTILLDEIGEIPPFVQAKLLHVLQDGQFSRLGGRCTLTPDARVIAATNIDVRQAIASNKLRADLYYRLNTFTIHLPPLRERRDEIPMLLKHGIERLANSLALPPLSVSPALLEACLQYSWPGNVRELQSFIKRYLILGEEELMKSELQSLEPLAAAPAPAAYPRHAGDLKKLVRNLQEEAELEAISRVLEETNWSRQQAARILNISARALRVKIRKYGLDSGPSSAESEIEAG